MWSVIVELHFSRNFLNYRRLKNHLWTCEWAVECRELKHASLVKFTVVVTLQAVNVQGVARSAHQDSRRHEEGAYSVYVPLLVGPSRGELPPRQHVLLRPDLPPATRTTAGRWSHCVFKIPTVWGECCWGWLMSSHTKMWRNFSVKGCWILNRENPGCHVKPCASPVHSAV